MADVMAVIKSAVGSFGACVFFGILFHAPRRAIIPAAMTGMIGYMVFSICAMRGWTPLAANFLGALTVAVLAETLARIQKTPAVVFSTIGIVPIVPGAGLYRTMLYLVVEDNSMAVTVGAETGIVSAGIAMAIALVTAITRVLLSEKQAGSR